MADKSKIAWTDATINPCYGCSPASPGCANCYAARQAHRLGALTEGTHKDGQWTGRINLFPQRMEQALRWRKPRRIFVGSMTDLFHKSVPDEFLDRVFAYMALANWHTFLVLTKRPERMREYLLHPDIQFRINATMEFMGSDGFMGPALSGWPLANVWLGVTAESQSQADERIPILLDTPAAKRFVSVEPMLGPVNLHRCQAFCQSTTLLGALTGTGWHQTGLSWVICGGESGPHARPMHPDWVRSLRDQCQAAGVPFFFKQWGEWAPYDPDNGIVPTPTNKFQWGTIVPSGEFYSSTTPWSDASGEDESLVVRVGKHLAGRLLDGREWNEFPEVRP